MRTGIRWSEIPIVVLAQNEAIEHVISRDTTLPRIVACAISRGWPEVYERIVDVILDFSQELVRQMRELGWELIYRRGRWIRVRPPRMRRKDGWLQEIESQFYDGSADRWIQARSVIERRQLEVAAYDRTSTLEDLAAFAKLIRNPDVKEPALQKLIEQAPYLLRSSHAELIAHADFGTAPKVDSWYPDVIHHPLFSNRIDITELKVPQMSLVAKRGKLFYQGHDVTVGITQVQVYGEIAVKATHQSQMEAIFGEPVTVNSRTLVIGMAAGIDPEELARVRSRIDNVNIKAYDEVLGEALDRFGY
jgi:hypothetical protein